ncbi:RNA polymerase sigma factor [Aeromicrobium endophyticum]|uniref:RNA polymerase sigma factor n=1 Tax=Aeromicrobium endophyticum TaxID=2292704 RepID=UPI0013147781|nr:sigma-70 family RNA polymerase sigma factor [Aeromicrobium endophyticum]
MDDEEFGALYDALKRPVHAFAARRVGPEAAKDVVSETFEVVWRKRDEFPPDRAAWPAWVVGIAKNKVLQELQRRTRKHHDNRFAQDWTVEPVTDDTSHSVLDSVESQQIYRELTPAEKHLFDVAFFRDLPPSQAAAVLGISTSAFTTRVSRLRQRLRDLSEATGVPGPRPVADTEERIS